MEESNRDVLTDVLYPNRTDSFSDEQQKTLFEQYKLLVETSEKLVARRQTVNAFFLSINTLTLTVIGLIIENLVPEHAQLTDLIKATIPFFAGILFCGAWITLVKSYRQLNHGKFQVIHALEDLLPAAVFKAEWHALGKGEDDKKYFAFTRTERYIPWVFLVSYLIVFSVNMIEPISNFLSNNS